MDGGRDSVRGVWAHGLGDKRRRPRVSKRMTRRRCRSNVTTVGQIYKETIEFVYLSGRGYQRRQLPQWRDRGGICRTPGHASGGVAHKVEPPEFALLGVQVWKLKVEVTKTLLYE